MAETRAAEKRANQLEKISHEKDALDRRVRELERGLQDRIVNKTR